MFDVEWTKEAVQRLKKLENKPAKRIVEKIEGIKDIPLHFLERMVGTDLWKLRVGDYRVLIQLDNEHKKLYIVMLDHRKNIYKNR
jgi:mRNA interferase RelE/StbE